METSPIGLYVDESAIRLVSDLSNIIDCLPSIHPSLLTSTTDDVWKEPVIPRFSAIVRIPEVAVDLLHLVKLSIGKVVVVWWFHVVLSPDESGRPLVGSGPPPS